MCLSERIHFLVIACVLVMMASQDRGHSAHEPVGQSRDLVVGGRVQGDESGPLVFAARAVGIADKDTVGNQGMEMDVEIDEAAKSLNEGNGAAPATGDSLFACSAALP